MKTRTRTPYQEETSPLFNSPLEGNVDLESMSDDELEALLFEEEEPKSKGIWNLPTVAGLSIIVIGIVYFLQELGLGVGFDLAGLVSMLPWLAGILIILLGFGVLSWRPKRKAKVKVKRGVDVKTGAPKVMVEEKRRGKRRLVRSRDKKVAGVAAGIAEYFNIDPTLVRIAFVIGTIASGGPFLLAYFALAMIMPKPEPLTLEERVTIIRDS